MQVLINGEVKKMSPDGTVYNDSNQPSSRHNIGGGLSKILRNPRRKNIRVITNGCVYYMNYDKQSFNPPGNIVYFSDWVLSDGGEGFKSISELTKALRDDKRTNIHYKKGSYHAMYLNGYFRGKSYKPGCYVWNTRCEEITHIDKLDLKFFYS